MPSIPSQFSSTGTLASQFLNVWIFNGNPDESISARSYREGVLNDVKKWKKRQEFIDKWWLKLFKKRRHCESAYLTDYEHAIELIKPSRESGFFTSKTKGDL